MRWTLEQFRATREAREDIGDAVGAQLFDEHGECVRAGFLYFGGLYIEIEPDGRYSLTLFRDTWCEAGTPENLAALEARLFDFAVRERFFETPDNIA